MAAAAAKATSEAAMSHVVLLCTMISLRALAGSDGPGFELHLAVLRGQPELDLRAPRLLADGGHLAGKVGLKAVEVETGDVSRRGGETLVERRGGLRVDALPEDDPLGGIVAARRWQRWRRVAHPRLAPLLEVAQAAVEELVVAVVPGFEVTQPEAVHRGRQVGVAQVAELHLDTAAQLVGRERQGAVEEALEVDAELLHVAAELVESLAERRPARGRRGRRRGAEARLRRPERRARRRRKRSRASSRASLGVHGSPRMLSDDDGKLRILQCPAGAPADRPAAQPSGGGKSPPIIRSRPRKGPSAAGGGRAAGAPGGRSAPLAGGGGERG